MSRYALGQVALLHLDRTYEKLCALQEQVKDLEAKYEAEKKFAAALLERNERLLNEKILRGQRG